MDAPHQVVSAPRLARDRLLLTTAAQWLLPALWILARIRFPDLPPSPEPCSAIALPTCQPRRFRAVGLRESMRLKAASNPGSSRSTRVSWRRRATCPRHARRGLRFRDDLASPCCQPNGQGRWTVSSSAIASDVASGCVVVRVAFQSSVPVLSHRGIAAVRSASILHDDGRVGGRVHSPAGVR